MKHACSCRLLALLLLTMAPRLFAEEAVTRLPALELYEQGQAWGVMRALEGDGVALNDLVLLENDGPGAGLSERGTYLEPLHRGVLARKVLRVEEEGPGGAAQGPGRGILARAAHAVIYMSPEDPAAPSPYYLLLNGRRIEGPPLSWHEPMWQWVPLPVETLALGENEIILACDAPPGEGYQVLIAREDEYADGGGAWTLGGNSALVAAGLIAPQADPPSEGLRRIAVGASSARSGDGGASWSPGLLGPEGNVRGEYSIRLSLERYVPEGVLLSAPLDLWQRETPAGLAEPVARARVKSLRVQGHGVTPPHTDLEWSIRFAEMPDPRTGDWGAFVPLGTGAQLDTLADPVQGRFAQLQVRLVSAHPLETPRLNAVTLTRELETTPPPARVHVQELENPQPRYSSYWTRFAQHEVPELQELRERLDVDAVLAGAHGDFEKINRLRHHVSQLWYHGLPDPEYPEWNALAILDRRDKLGKGGMCMQFVVVFVQALQALGYQARHVNLFNHESAEVWVDELGKWVHVDPESVFDSYEFHTGTGAPLNALEQHQHFLQRYGFSADRPIPWASPEPWCNWPASGVPEQAQPLDISTFTGWINDPDPDRRPPQHNLAGFLRVIPRNDFLAHPTPRPPSNGRLHWPWSGYLCWYDAATPRKLQHALHSDRIADFYPVLNRVHFTASYTDTPGILELDLFSQAPAGTTIETQVDDGPWTPSGATFRWRLRPSALNRLEMRTRNLLGVTGKPSRLVVFWHYQAPYSPQE